MPTAPPAEQAMHRHDVGGDVKLDASEFDGCWLEIPNRGIWMCCETWLHAQKHIDADTVVTKSVNVSVMAAIFTCMCPCVQWVCCPHSSFGKRAVAEGINSFEYLNLGGGDKRPPKINVDDPWAPGRGYDADGTESDDEEVPGEVLLDAQGFERFGALLHPQSPLPWMRDMFSLLSYTYITDEEKKIWRYNSRSQVTITSKMGQEKAKASRSALSCCFAPSAINRHDQLFAAYYVGYHGKGDRPLTSAEQDDKEACISTFAGALKSGNIPMLRRYRAVVGGGSGFTNILAANGHLEALKWARDEGVELDPLICAAAARSGNLEILKFCKENGASFNYCLVSEKAVERGPLECVEYCHKNGAPWGKKTLYLAVHHCFARRGTSPSPEILKYCLDNGAPEDTHAIECACRWTALEFVKVFAESSHPFPSGNKQFAISDYDEKVEVCNKIAEICAGKGYSVSYKEHVPDSYYP